MLSLTTNGSIAQNVLGRFNIAFYYTYYVHVKHTVYEASVKS